MKLNRNLLIFLPLLLLVVFTLPKHNSPPQITNEAVSTVNEEIIETESGYGTHIVQPGQNLSSIAQIYYSNPNGWQKIAEANHLANPNLLSIGQQLIIPDYELKGQILTGVSIEAILEDSYVVKKGDTLWSIAERAYGNPYKYPQLALFNNYPNPDHIEIGWTVQIPREIQ